MSDAERFRALGHRLIDQLADHLAAQIGGEGAVLPWREPSELAAAWPPSFPEQGNGDLGGLLARVLEASNRLHHPRYVGHQVAAPLPEAALCDLVASLLNNGMAIYEMGPAGTAMERAVLRWMADRLGLGADADGVLTSGGSAGNLTALLAARQAQAGFDAWGQGSHAGPPLAVLAAESAHYSVARAVQIMGWGEGGVIPVATDDRFRMASEALPAALAAGERAGRRVIAVVASAPSTAAGTFDPLALVAEFCRSRGLWFHVDAAHGAAAVLSERHRGLLYGIEHADSVIWDAHKMLRMPALVTAVIFKEGRRSHEAFSQVQSYLFGAEAKRWEVGLRTLECTKRMMSLKLYATLATLGTAPFADHVAGTFDLARRFGERLQAASDFELLTEPESNIVCFRHRPTGTPVEALDALQEAVRRRLVREGSFYLVQTSLRGAVWLRTTLMSPNTRDEDLEALLGAIRGAAATEARS